MKAIHAIYEQGIFRPLEAVDLPAARAGIIAVLSQRLDSGETDVTARHSEHGAGPSWSDLADFAEPMNGLPNVETDHAIYGV